MLPFIDLNDSSDIGMSRSIPREVLIRILKSPNSVVVYAIALKREKWVLY